MKSFNKISIFGLALLISCSAPVLAGKGSKQRQYEKKQAKKVAKLTGQQPAASSASASTEEAPATEPVVAKTTLQFDDLVELARANFQPAPLAIEYHPELTQPSEVIDIPREVSMNSPEVVSLPQEAMDVVMEQSFPQPQPAPLAIEYHPELTAPQAVEEANQSNDVNAIDVVLPQAVQIIEDNVPAILVPETEPAVQPATVSPAKPGWISRLWTGVKAKANAVKSLTNRALNAVTPTFVEIPSDFGDTGMIDQTSFAQPVQPIAQDQNLEAAGTGLEIEQPVVVLPEPQNNVQEPVVARQAPLAIEYHPELTQQPEVIDIPRELFSTNAPEIVTLPREAMNVAMEQLFPQPQQAPLAIEYHPELTAPEAVVEHEDDQSDEASSLPTEPSFNNLAILDSDSSVDFDDNMSDSVVELRAYNVDVPLRRHSIDAIPGRDEVNPAVVVSQPLQVIEDYVPAVVAPETEPTAQPVDQVIEEVVAPVVNPVVDIESQEPVVPVQQGWFSSFASFATAKAKAAATYVNENPAELAAILIGTAAAGKVAHTVYNKTAAQPSVETVFSIPCKEGASLQLTNDGKLAYVGTTENALHKANVLKTDILDAKEGYVDLRTAQGSYFVRITKETLTETIENTVVEYAQYTLQLIKEEADGLWVYEDEGVELETAIKVDVANNAIIPVNEQEQAHRTRVLSLINKLAAATQSAPQEAALASN